MKLLDSFTVERLEELIKSASLEPCDAEPIYDNVQVREIAALARIALAAKRAEPVAYMTYKGHLIHAGDPKLSEYSDPQPLYDGPQLNSPEIPDGWIKCSDQMPEKEVSVIAFSDDGSMWIAYYDKESRCWDDGDFFNDIPGITHWMPLPAAPEKGNG